MTNENLFNAITEVNDALITEAAEAKPVKKKAQWLKIGSIAAAFAVVAGLGAAVFGGAIPRQPTGLGPGGNSTGSGHDEGSVFARYAGPVFPMTALAGGEGLAVSRDVTYDFAPWAGVWRSNEELVDELGLSGKEREEALADHYELYPEGGYVQDSLDLLVTDRYTLANPSGEDRTVTLLYPFVSSFWTLPDNRPTMAADGVELDTKLYAGIYSGGFQGAIGAENQETGTLNLKSLKSWEGYRDLLNDGSYQARALEEFPDLSHIPVTVYKFTDAWGPEREGNITNPSIHASFSLDYSKTTVLSYGFHGGCFDQEAGTMDQSFSIPAASWSDTNEPCYLFVLGEPVSDWQVYVSSSGAPDAGEDLKFGVEAGVTVEQYDTDLESALRPAAQLLYGVQQAGGSMPDFELFFGLMKLDMAAYGILSDSPMERYGEGWLAEEDFSGVDRVFYLETQVTIPAEGSVIVEAKMTKGPSFDHYCAHTENQGVYGYDMVTRLGTKLDITALTASAVNTQYARIIRQNYGFDWENGVNTVALDPAIEHYYLEVSRIEMD